MPAPTDYAVAHERTFDVTTDSTGGRKFATDGGGPIWCIGYCIKADSNNTVWVGVGEGSATYPLVPGEVRYSDLPPGVMVDLGKVLAQAMSPGSAVATATSGQVLHVTAWIVTANPPAGTRVAAQPQGFAELPT